MLSFGHDPHRKTGFHFSGSCSISCLEHDLSGKPGPTFPDHALSLVWSMIFSENRYPLFRIMLLPKFLRERQAARSTAAHRARRKMRQRESLIGVAWGARPKPGPASPANVSKRGLSARLYVPNQTLILVNARLPKEILTAGNQGRPGGYGGWNRVPSWVLASPLPEVRALARLEGRRPFCGRFILRGSLRSRLQRQRRSRCAGIGDAVSHSRGALRPSFAGSFPPSSNRGRREDRVRAAPAVPCAVCTK